MYARHLQPLLFKITHHTINNCNTNVLIILIHVRLHLFFTECTKSNSYAQFRNTGTKGTKRVS